jgi:integrase
VNSHNKLSKLCNGLDVQRAKAIDKPITLRFGHGLFLHVTPAGTKSWRCQYQSGGRNTNHHLGHYLPDGSGMSLADARLARAQVRKTVKDGGNPAVDKLADKTARQKADAATFESIALAWHEACARRWSEGFADHVMLRLRKHVFPVLGKLPVARFSFKHAEHLLASVLSVAPAQAVHVKQHMSGVLDYARIQGLVPFNPLRDGASRFLPKRDRGAEQHQPRAETIEAARAVLRAVETSQAGATVKLMHRLMALTALRKNEMIGARWDEFSFGLWTIPWQRMKAKRDHLVPLSPQAEEVVAAARMLAKTLNRSNDLVFPSLETGLAQNRNTINDCMGRALVRNGMASNAHVPHGWRGTFSTIMNDRYPVGGYDRLIEMNLAHQVQGVTAASYNSAEHVPSRRALFCEWADLLLVGAQDAFTLIGLQAMQVTDNVVTLREAA